MDITCSRSRDPNHAYCSQMFRMLIHGIYDVRLSQHISLLLQSSQSASQPASQPVSRSAVSKNQKQSFYGAIFPLNQSERSTSQRNLTYLPGFRRLYIYIYIPIFFKHLMSIPQRLFHTCIKICRNIVIFFFSFFFFFSSSAFGS